MLASKNALEAHVKELNTKLKQAGDHDLVTETKLAALESQIIGNTHALIHAYVQIEYILTYTHTYIHTYLRPHIHPTYIKYTYIHKYTHSQKHLQSMFL